MQLEPFISTMDLYTHPLIVSFKNGKMMQIFWRYLILKKAETSIRTRNKIHFWNEPVIACSASKYIKKMHNQ